MRLTLFKEEAYEVWVSCETRRYGAHKVDESAALCVAARLPRHQ